MHVASFVVCKLYLQFAQTISEELPNPSTSTPPPLPPPPAATHHGWLVVLGARLESQTQTAESLYGGVGFAGFFAAAVCVEDIFFSPT